MSKNQNKTIANDMDVETFISSISPTEKQNDTRIILEIMHDITGHKAMMWGSSIIGFGKYHYKYESGREGTMCRTGFSPRKNAITIYCMSGFAEQAKLLDALGKHKLGKSCLYIKKLSDVNIDVLCELIQEDWDIMNAKYS